MPSLDQILLFQEDRSDLPRSIQEKLYGKNIEKAYFLYDHALNHNSRWQMYITEKFENTNFQIKFNLKSNLQRIAERISDEGDNPFYITDMLRATILVTKP